MKLMWISKDLIQTDEEFLTHTVQMKLRMGTSPLMGQAQFLTHTVQMKPEITTPDII